MELSARSISSVDAFVGFPLSCLCVRVGILIWLRFEYSFILCVATKPTILFMLIAVCPDINDLLPARWSRSPPLLCAGNPFHAACRQPVK